MTNTLKVFTVGAEIVVVGTLAVSSYHIAFSGPDPDWLAGAPILTVVALESLRLPLAFRLRRMRLLGRAMSVAMLIGLSVITGEAASVAFENLIFQRSRPVIEAEAELKKIEIAAGTLDEEAKRQAKVIEQRAADLKAARDHRAEIDKPVQLATLPAPKTCWRAGKGKHARAVAYDCSGSAMSDAAKGNRDSQAAHADELRTASEQVALAEKRLSDAEANVVERASSDEAVKLASQRVADERAMNPMFRVAAAWQRTPVQDLSSSEFEQVKHFAVIALAGATAFVTMTAAIICSMPERGSGSGKVSRAVRAWLARRRKRLTVHVPGPVKTQVEIREHTRMVYLPVDNQGRVLNPDANARVETDVTP